MYKDGADFLKCGMTRNLLMINTFIRKKVKEEVSWFE